MSKKEVYFMKKFKIMLICIGMVMSLFMFSSCLTFLGALLGGSGSSSSSSSSQNKTSTNQGYDYHKSFYDYAGREIYRVRASDQAVTDMNLVVIYDYETNIARCFVCPDKKGVLDLYEILSRMNLATLQETIRSTNWVYWMTGNNTKYIYYKDAGLQ